MMMNETEFRDVLDTCSEKSGNDLQEYLAQFSDAPVVVSLLVGTEFDDIGLGRTTVGNAAKAAFGSEEFVDDAGKISESLREFDEPDADCQISIEELYLDLHMLDDLSGRRQTHFLTEMFIDYSCPSVVSFAVLNDLSLGFGESTLCKAFDVRDSQPFYESVVDIVRDDPDDRRTSPECGVPFDPMLAVPESRGEPSNAVAQRKIDGNRILLHIMNDGSVKAFTRSLNEVTESLPELREMPFDQLNGETILDGEVIAENGSYADTSARIGRKASNVERDVEMNFAIFDCVLYNGCDVSNDMFYTRFIYAESCIESLDDDERIYTVPIEHDIEAARMNAATGGEEGIIVKDITSTYEFDKRSASWQKQKLDSETIDVRVTDLHEGEGRTSGMLGSMSVESEDGVDLGRVGSGFTDEEREKIWEFRDVWPGGVIEVEARGLDEKLRMPIYQRQRDKTEANTYDLITEILPEM